MMGDTKVVVITVLIAGALVGAGTAYVGINQSDMSKQEAGEKVAGILEDRTGSSQEVVNVEEANGLYKVQLNSDDQLQTYHVTKDGKMLAGQMTELAQVQETIEKQNMVSSCLNDQNAVLYGNASQRATVAQIQALGGAQKVSGFYKDVNTQENLQEAADRGVQQVPTLWVDGRTLPNANNLDRVSNFANCQ